MPNLEKLSINTEADKPQSRKTTVEDADDESDEPKADKKKKKKKPKKKKKSAGSTEAHAESPVVESPTLPPVPEAAPAPPVTSPPATPAKTPAAKAPTSPKSPVAAAPKKAPSIASTLASGGLASSASLPLPVETTAQSAHSYIKEAKLAEANAKVKTRPDQPAVPPPEKEKKKGFFSKLGSNKKAEEMAKEKPNPNAFNGLKKKTKSYVQKLFGVTMADKKGSLKWEQFLQVSLVVYFACAPGSYDGSQIMKEMGFEYDPSTAGSSVRFDPPNPTDRVSCSSVVKNALC